MICKRALFIVLLAALSGCKEELAALNPSAPPTSAPSGPVTAPPPSPVVSAPAAPVQDEAPTVEPEPVEEAPPAVEPPPTHEVKLSWQAPATRENGDPLLPTEIAGFEIYFYEESCNSSCESILTVDKDIFSKALTLAEPGTWHFAIAVIDTQGLKSDLSNPVSVAVGS